MEVSRPGQVSYGALLPRDLDNLLVVTTISATHVGWGTVRQTPTLMHLAESAAWAVVLALEHDVLPAALDVDHLQRHLVGRGLMLSFFNDVDMASPGDWVPAMQYLGTKGFFGSYDARPGEPLTAGLAVLWAQATAAWMAGGARAEEWAMRVAEEEARESVPVTWAEFCALLQRAWGERFAKCALPPAPAQHVSRAVACQYCYQLLAKADRV